MVKVYGRVTDFENNPLENAEVFIKDRVFNDVYKTVTNKNGEYEIQIVEGLYYAIAIVKDYTINYLEYWAWNVPVYKNTEISCKIGGLEVYAINCYDIQGAWPSLMIYFRPMSLQLAKDLIAKSVEPIKISPMLYKDSIKVSVNNKLTDILELNGIKEYVGECKRMGAYLIQAQLPHNINKDDYNKIDIEIYNKETDEKGQGCSFWNGDD